MTHNTTETSSSVSRLLSVYSQMHMWERIERQASQLEPLPPRIHGSARISTADLDARWLLLPHSEQHRNILMDQQTVEYMSSYQGNIENFIGTVKIPVGVAGPLRINGMFAQGDYYIPLATTEATLVASYHRGAQVITEAGGCSAIVLDEGVGRAPAFAFRTLAECGVFVSWVLEQWEMLRREAEDTTHYGKLKDMQVAIEGNHVYLHFRFETGNAAGQNMVTIATDAICSAILRESPIKPQYFFLDANTSSDKKASMQSMVTVRGKKVSAEVLIPAQLVQKRLHTSPELLAQFWRMATVGSLMSGTIGAQWHIANGLAALYIACGQDAACVAESAIGLTRFEVAEQGALYASVTLPNLIVGTVGGGTHLPSQSACLEMLGVGGDNGARALAEISAGVCLAGEISLAAAVCAKHFARAHKKRTRARAIRNVVNIPEREEGLHG